MRTVDFHCDVLSKMWEDSQASFVDDPHLDVTLQRMEEGDLALQVFAVFLSEKWGRPSFERVLAQIDTYRSRIVKPGHLKPLLWQEQVQEFGQRKNGRYGVLSLEGVDGLEGNLYYVQLLFEMGVRFMGITWNYANWAADGALEQRNGGFTERGRQLVELCNSTGIILDVSHLSQAGFWELAELTKGPIIASHSNAYSVCQHPRNLNDEQIRALIALNGMIGIAFVPWFIRSGVERVKPEDVLPHIEKICEMGGEKHIMFGSDFDGIDQWVAGLEHPGRYSDFQELLLKHYPESMVKGWMSEYALRFLEQNLPSLSTQA
ncbi:MULTISPECIES: dipeptidase [Paenibacillus]|uniref:Membrane dipeptidase n=1 Tax=Paenibacillus lautus TaxID=1401 RepID=A0A1R1AVN5_PAELA|nr:membrane dipeptidase [Paenibacillus lautus]OME89480.1 membrane dipeptidase [Paenibacillus lautus]